METTLDSSIHLSFHTSLSSQDVCHLTHCPIPSLTHSHSLARAQLSSGVSQSCLLQKTSLLTVNNPLRMNKSYHLQWVTISWNLKLDSHLCRTQTPHSPVSKSKQVSPACTVLRHMAEVGLCPVLDSRLNELLSQPPLWAVPAEKQSSLDDLCLVLTASSFTYDSFRALLYFKLWHFLFSIDLKNILKL